LAAVYDAVIFDLDGVLIDSRTAFTRSFNHALATSGLPEQPAESLYRFIGPPLESNFAMLLGEQDRDLALVPALVTAYRDRYRAESPVETLLYDGVRELLAATELPMAIATLKPGPMARPLMEALGIADRFVAIEGPALSDAEETKDVTVARALEALGDPDPARTPFVGDRGTDIAAARKLGLPAVAAVWGMGDAAELAAADIHVDTPGELASLLSGSAPSSS
jgi:phosphoglycolate phosphatase